MLTKMNRKDMTIIMLYVDDILMLADNKKSINWLYCKLEEEYETVDIDTLESFTYLGMVLSTEPNGMALVNMKGYTVNVVSDYEAQY